MMATPTLFVLVDTSMIGGIRTYYPQSLPEWLYPLYADQDAALFGPVLIDAAAVEAAQEFGQVQAMWNARKPSLHISLIRSTLTASELVQHLQQFTYIFDDAGALYCLRFADCRVLANLPETLIPQQWRGLTYPMAEWQIHQRDDSRFSMPLAAHKGEQNKGPWVITAEQIEHMTGDGEADFLLNHLGYTPQVMGAHTHAYWSLAYQCVTLWQKSGNGNREVLHAFARQMIATRGTALQQRNWVAFLADAKPQDVLSM